MTKPILSLRPAGAAIAAVLALSSTAVVAQDIVAPPTMPAPAPAPTLVIPQPGVAPAPAPVAPAPVIVLPTQPSAPAVAEASAPAPRAIRTAAQRPTVTARPAARSAAPVAARDVAPVAPAVPAAPVKAIPPADIEFAPTQTALPADATPELDTVAPADTSGGLDAGELGLIGGALAIGGIAAAALFARRRRGDPAPEPVDVFAARSAAPPAPFAPTPFVPRASDPATRPDPVGPLAADYVAPAAVPLTARRPVAAGTGYHVRMAEQGPTADNPFLTRKNRLRRARFLDAQEARMNAEAAAPADDWLDAYRKEYRTASAR